MTRASDDSDESARARLAAELLPAPWAVLATHHRRDALFVVDAAVALLDVAVALAEDDARAVTTWLESERLTRPSAAEVSAWEAEEGARFVCAIVQPFVVAQRLEHFVASASA